jgi:hypothetical protein
MLLAVVVPTAAERTEPALDAQPAGPKLAACCRMLSLAWPLPEWLDDDRDLPVTALHRSPWRIPSFTVPQRRLAMTKITDYATGRARAGAAAVDGQARDLPIARRPSTTERFPPYPRRQQLVDRVERAIWAVSEETWPMIRISILRIAIAAVVVTAAIVAVRLWH